MLLLLILILIPTNAKRQQTIPHRIFQTWKSKNIVREDFIKWQMSWKRYHPSFRYVLWDDDDNRRFIATHYGWFLETYDRYDQNIKRADVIRYFYLYHYGGIYADIDFEALKSQIPLMTTSASVILGRLPDIGGSSRYHEWYRANNIPNALMMSQPRTAFWLSVFDLLLKRPRGIAPEAETGPVLLKAAVQKWKKETNHKIQYAYLLPYLVENPPVFEGVIIKILDPHAWYYNGWKKPHRHHPSNAFAVTYWTGTWKQGQT